MLAIACKNASSSTLGVSGMEGIRLERFDKDVSSDCSTLCQFQTILRGYCCDLPVR